MVVMFLDCVKGQKVVGQWVLSGFCHMCRRTLKEQKILYESYIVHSLASGHTHLTKGRHQRKGPPTP
jgi:hypothetical protein